jgi:branched-chain amino acid transport system substrate-binding protein
MSGSGKRFWFARTTTCLLAVAALAIAGQQTSWAQGEPIKVGQFLDLTGGGASAAEAAKLGVDIAIADINKAGGIAGRKLTVVLADTQTDATVGVGEIKRLVLQEKVDVVFGPVISQVLLAAAPVLNDRKVPSFGATGSELITPKVAPYFFTVLVNADAQAQKIVKEAADVLKAKSGAIISDDGAQAKSFVESMKREMASRGMKLTGEQSYQYRAIDMTPQLLALRRGNPDTLFLFSSSGEDVGNTLKSLMEINWDLPVTGNYTVSTFAEAALKIAGVPAFKRVTGVNYKAFNHCSNQPPPKAFLDFVATAKAFDPAKSARISLPFASLFYDAVRLYKAAVEGSGGKTDGTSVAAWIEKNAPNYKGINEGLSASGTSHFLVGVDALATVRPDKIEEGGVQLRTGC